MKPIGVYGSIKAYYDSHGGVQAFGSATIDRFQDKNGRWCQDFKNSAGTRSRLFEDGGLALELGICSNGQFQITGGLETADSYADINVLYDYGGCQTQAHLLASGGTNFSSPQVWRVQNDYCLSAVKFSASGDFDGNGTEDIAMAYDYTGCHMGIHCFMSNGTSFDYEPWWIDKYGYCLYAVKGMVAGDFNGDGKDDLAFVYDYGSCQTRIHVYLSDGNHFVYQGDSGWWIGNGWYCAYATRHVASGDLNGDGKDDIIVSYRYGPASTALHTFLSTGSGFNYHGNNWFFADGWFSLDAMKFMSSGDLNGDGLDDVVMACRYGPSETALLAFLSTGSGFNYQGWWWHVGYYSLDAVPYMQVGDINGDGKADVAMAYRYGSYNSAVHCFISTASNFTYQPYWFNANGWYGWDYTKGFAIGKFNQANVLGKNAQDIGDEPVLPKSFTLSQNYPNPFNPVTNISYSLPEASQVTLDIFNILGQKVETLIDEFQNAGQHTISWAADEHSSGIYFYRLTTDGFTETKKMVLLK